MSLLIAIVVILSVSAIAAIMSAAEAASALVSPGRTLRLVESETSGAKALDALMDKAYRFRASAALVSGAAYAAASIMGMWAFLMMIEGVASWLAGLLGAIVGWVFVYSVGHALPRTVAVQNPEGVALTFAGVALSITRIIYPFAKILTALWRWGVRLAVGRSAAVPPWVTEDEYRAHTTDAEESAREETEEALFEAVSEFADKVVREVMVPRTDMTCLSDTATAGEAIEIIEQAGYSRLPVYRETLDDIHGVLYAKDLLAAVSRDPNVIPATIVRPPFFVPETKPAQELLLEMRARTHIAIVADEYGGTAGLVTIEDLLEEIVGEIFDEYDLAVPMMVEAGDGRFRVDARLPVDDLNEQFGTAIELEADTLGGVVMELAGRIPEIGDSIDVEGLRIIVDELEGTRVRQLLVESAGTLEAEEEGRSNA